jgi:hypothetical protein
MSRTQKRKFKKLKSIEEFDEYLKFKRVRNFIKFDRKIEKRYGIYKNCENEKNLEKINFYADLFFDKRYSTFLPDNTLQCDYGKGRSFSDFYLLLSYYFDLNFNHKDIFNFLYHRVLKSAKISRSCYSPRICPNIANVNFGYNYMSDDIRNALLNKDINYIKTSHYYKLNRYRCAFSRIFLANCYFYSKEILNSNNIYLHEYAEI